MLGPIPNFFLLTQIFALSQTRLVIKIAAAVSYFHRDHWEKVYLILKEDFKIIYFVYSTSFWVMCTPYTG